MKQILKKLIKSVLQYNVIIHVNNVLEKMNILVRNVRLIENLKNGKTINKPVNVR